MKDDEKIEIHFKNAKQIYAFSVAKKKAHTNGI